MTIVRAGSMLASTRSRSAPGSRGDTGAGTAPASQIPIMIAANAPPLGALKATGRDAVPSKARAVWLAAFAIILHVHVRPRSSMTAG